MTVDVIAGPHQLTSHNIDQVLGMTAMPKTTYLHTHNHLTTLCPGLPGWAGTRRNIHPLTPILIIGHPLSTFSIYWDPLHPLCSVYVLDSLSPGPLWSSSWSGTLYFILQAFLHAIIIFFSQHMPIPTTTHYSLFRNVYLFICLIFAMYIFYAYTVFCFCWCLIAKN